MGGIAAGVFGLAMVMAGLAVGRLVAKIDPVGTLCGTCDGLSRLPRDVVPGVAPAACPECGRTVRVPTLIIIVAVITCLVTLQALGDGFWTTVANGALGGSLAALVWTDARYRVLPARLVWGATASSLVPLALAELDYRDDRLWTAILVSLASGAAFLALHLVSPAGLAFGDVRLAVLLGLHLGWRSGESAFWAFFLAALLGALVGLLWRRTKGTKTLPFGPFLAGSTAIALLVSASTSA